MSLKELIDTRTAIEIEIDRIDHDLSRVADRIHEISFGEDSIDGELKRAFDKRRHLMARKLELQAELRTVQGSIDMLGVAS